ncbi:MAG: capsule assembly Wzi family protein [Rudanella sp.]|nr:capsule assembly Wzi family protein [Rudanella sp.]
MQFRCLPVLMLFYGVVQGQAPKPLLYRQELLAMSATAGELPFWFRANQYGIIPRGQTVYSLRSNWQIDYRPVPKTPGDSAWANIQKIDWGWGLEGVANMGRQLESNNPDRSRKPVRQMLLPEGYIKAKYKAVEAWAGRRRETYGLGGDSPVGSGSFSWSGNALPMLKVQLGMPDFWPARSRFSVKGTFGQGWFDNGFVEYSLLHQKSVYVRWGRPTARLKFYGGFNHQVQWAGRTKRLTNEFIKDNQFPSSLQAYWYTIVGTSLNTVRNIDTTRYSQFDRGNRVGNHLGTLDVGAEIRVGKASVLLYRQSIYEDGSLFYLINIKDGLHGMRIRNHKTSKSSGFRLNDFVLEYLNTFSQGGDAFVDGDPFRRGRDNYFNHGQYRDGWAYKGRTLGTPFIAPATDLKPNLPHYLVNNNNRVRVYHAGLSGQIANSLTFSLKASYSQNAGTYQVPFVP